MASPPSRPSASSSPPNGGAAPNAARTASTAVGSGSAKKVEIIGPYQLGPTIGEGMYAKVKLGEDEFRQQVAIKVFDKVKIERTLHALLQVEKEINALRGCKHPNIVQFHEVLETDTKVYLVMEFLAGGELYDYIQTKGKLDESEVRRLFTQIVSAVQHCHKRGIVHRDIKPENILLNEHGDVKLVDFGLSNYVKIIGEDGKETRPAGAPADQAITNILKTQCGSPHYAAPEVLTGLEYEGPLVDVWSLGVLLYAMLCGSLPFTARTMPALIKKICDCKYTVPSSMSATARDLLSRILRTNPQQRLSLDSIRSHPWMLESRRKSRPVAIAIGGANASPPSGSDRDPDSPRTPPYAGPSRPEIDFTPKLPSMIPPTPRNTPAPQLLGSSPTTTTSSSPGGTITVTHIPTTAKPRRSTDSNGPREVTCRTCHKRLNVRVNDRGLLQLSGSVTSITKDGKIEGASSPTSKTTQPISIPSKTGASSGASASHHSDDDICHCISSTPAGSLPAALTGGNGTTTPATGVVRKRVEVTIGINGETGDADGLLDDATPLVRGLSFGPAATGGAPLTSNGPAVSGLRLRLGGASTATPVAGAQPIGWEEKLDDASQRERDALFNMARRGQVADIMNEIKREAADLRTRGPVEHGKWSSLFLFACENGYLPVVQAIVQSDLPFNVNCVLPKNGWTGLMLATSGGHLPIVKCLCDYKLTSIHYMSTIDGQTAIAVAREKKRSDIAQYLTDKSGKRLASSRDKSDGGMRRQFMMAVEAGDVAKVKHLIKLSRAPVTPPPGGAGAKISEDKSSSVDDDDKIDVRMKGIDNFTALHHASRRGHTEIVRLLLSESPPAEVNALTKSNWSSLMMACAFGHREIVRLLLDGGADSRGVSKDGESAMKLAVEKHENEIVEMLQRNLASLSSSAAATAATTTPAAATATAAVAIPTVAPAASGAIDIPTAASSSPPSSS